MTPSSCTHPSSARFAALTDDGTSPPPARLLVSPLFNLAYNPPTHPLVDAWLGQNGASELRLERVGVGKKYG